MTSSIDEIAEATGYHALYVQGRLALYEAKGRPHIEPWMVAEIPGAILDGDVVRMADGETVPAGIAWLDDNQRPLPQKNSYGEVVRYVRNVSTFQEHGIQWEERAADETTWTPYRTNREGEGLWRETYNGTGLYGWRQVVGTAQWSLPSDPTKARRRLTRTVRSDAD
jgi:hypothetical protein